MPKYIITAELHIEAECQNEAIERAEDVCIGKWYVTALEVDE